MIDLTSKTAKKRYHAYLLRQNAIFENRMAKKLIPVLRGQWNDAADQIADGTSNFIITRSDKLLEVLRDEMLKIGLWYFGEFNNSLEALQVQKFLMSYNLKQEIDIDDFMQSFQPWLEGRAAEEITKINDTTRSLIRVSLKRSLESGKTYYEASKDIKEVGSITSNYRAMRIARTELHTASGEATQISAEKSTVKIKEKEWSTAGDERVRSESFNHVAADGERVKLEEYYVNTGESLRYPGDSMGSGGNIINCRCVSLFDT